MATLLEYLSRAEAIRGRKKAHFLRHLVVICGLFLVVAAIYLPYAPLYQFVSDDYSWINITRGESLPALLTSLRGTGAAFVLTWRPVNKLSVMANYYVTGTTPVFYYLTNLAIHLSVALLIYLFVWRVTRHRGVSAGAALLFGAHQAATLPASWLAGRQDSLGTLWVLLTVFLFLLYLEACTVKRSMALASGAVAALVLALGSRESAVVIPGLLIAVCALRNQGPWIPGALAKAGAVVLISMVLVAVYWAIRLALGPVTYPFTVLGGGPVSGLLHAGQLGLVYLATLFSPIDMGPWHSMIGGFSGVSVVAVYVALSCVGGLGWALVSWLQRALPAALPAWWARLALFSTLWVVITLLPLVSLNVPIPTRAYMALVGAAILTATVFAAGFMLARRYVGRPLVIWLLAGVVASLVAWHMAQSIHALRMLTQEGAMWTDAVTRVTRDIQVQMARTPASKVYLVLREPKVPLALFSADLKDAVELRIGASAPQIEVLEGGECPNVPGAACVQVADLR
ncbi:MAG: hypothetical protein Q7T26_11915 [Dehalococcoidia bacterium]|nr:hypothetical protein [Dehalococcoidia bacterium]